MSTDTSPTAANDKFEEQLALYWKQYRSCLDADVRMKSRDARLLRIVNSSLAAKKTKRRRSGRKLMRKRLLKGRLEIVKDGSRGRLQLLKGGGGPKI